MEEILTEIQSVMKQVKESELINAVEVLIQAKRVFVLGEGRSGLQGKGFAMRLMHLRETVYVIGESTTPSVKTGDLLIAISGSGTTASTLALAKKAKSNGVKVLGISSEANSPLIATADFALMIPGATKTGSGLTSIQLLSTLFDQTLHIALDYICLLLSKRKAVGNEEAHQQHSNME